MKHTREESVILALTAKQFQI